MAVVIHCGDDDHLLCPLDLVPSTLGYLLNMFALARVRASTTAVYVYAQPFITAVGSLFLLDEPLESRMGWSLPFLFLGVWLVSRRKRPKD